MTVRDKTYACIKIYAGVQRRNGGKVMKIPGELSKINSIYRTRKSSGLIGKTESASPKKDVLSISNEAKDFQTVKRALKNVPDIRKDKVADILSKYESGGYNVSGREIADKVINSVFDKKA